MKQIKAKFAVLLVYIDLPNSNEQDGELVKHIDALIKEAEDKSSAMCQDCGAAGTPKTIGMAGGFASLVLRAKKSAKS